MEKLQDWLNENKLYLEVLAFLVTITALFLNIKVQNPQALEALINVQTASLVILIIFSIVYSSKIIFENILKPFIIMMKKSKWGGKDLNNIPKVIVIVFFIYFFNSNLFKFFIYEYNSSLKPFLGMLYISISFLPFYIMVGIIKKLDKFLETRKIKHRKGGIYDMLISFILVLTVMLWALLFFKGIKVLEINLGIFLKK